MRGIVPTLALLCCGAAAAQDLHLDDPDWPKLSVLERASIDASVDGAIFATVLGAYKGWYETMLRRLEVDAYNNDGSAWAARAVLNECVAGMTVEDLYAIVKRAAPRSPDTPLVEFVVNTMERECEDAVTRLDNAIQAKLR